MKDKRIISIIYALLAAVFYVVNVPMSKLLMTEVSPTFMASFLYLGAGIGITVMFLIGGRYKNEADKLAKSDLPYTIGMIALDIIAPILLMIGINIGTSSNASLLGNFEIVATTIIAGIVFGEMITARLWCAILLIIASSVILTFDGADSLRFSCGSLFVLGVAVSLLIIGKAE